LQDFSLFVTLLIAKNASNMSENTYFTGQPVYCQVIKLQNKKNTKIAKNLGQRALCEAFDRVETPHHHALWHPQTL